MAGGFRLFLDFIVNTGKGVAGMKAVGREASAVAKNMSGMGIATRAVNRMIGAGLSAFGASSVWGIMKDSAQAAADFNTQFAGMASILEEEDIPLLGSMKKRIFELSNQYGVSAGEIAAGMKDLVGSGVPAADAMRAIEKSIRGSIIAQTDLHSITETSIKLVRAMGKESLGVASDTEGLEKVQRVLWNVQDKGIVSMDELYAVIAELGPMANIAGISIEELAAMFQIMTLKAGNAADAKTGIQSFLVSMARQSKQTQKEAHALGLAYDLESLKAKGLVGFLEDVTNATNNNLTSLVHLSGRQEGARAMLTLTKDGVKELADMIDYNTTSVNKYNSAWAMFNPSVELAAANEQMKNMKIQFGELALPPVVTGLTNVALTVDAVSAAIRNLSTAFSEMNPILKTIFKALNLPQYVAFKAGKWLLKNASLNPMDAGFDPDDPMFDEWRKQEEKNREEAARTGAAGGQTPYGEEQFAPMSVQPMGGAYAAPASGWGSNTYNEYLRNREESYLNQGRQNEMSIPVPNSLPPINLTTVNNFSVDGKKIATETNKQMIKADQRAGIRPTNKAAASQAGQQAHPRMGDNPGVGQ